MEFENIFESSQELEKIDEDDEIYEMIEAPKYVDLTRADHFLPDDRNWFCLRIGCDQEHEDVDPDALHKSFVLRVMAARSPNLRLRKALRGREVPSAYKKCPLSAPAKPSKPRVCRFTALASVSQKVVAVKVKAVPASSINSTPSEKLKKSTAVAKALTTPRAKNCIPSSDHFRSVQNPKRSDAVSNSKVVAKVLVFNTPKKAERSKSSSASENPLTDICDGMKKLEINSQRKKPSRNSRAASELSTLKECPQRLNRRVKNYDDCKDQGAKSLKRTKSTRRFVKKSICPQPQSIGNTDTEVDGESKSGSYGVSSVSGTSRSNEGSRSEQQSDLETNRVDAVTTQEECSTAKDTSFIGTPLTEICNGLKKLEINSQRKKPSLNSSKFAAPSTSRPNRSRIISDPPTSQRMKNRSKYSENSKEPGAKSLKSTKNSRTNTSKNLSCPQLPGMANGAFQTDKELENGSLGDCTVSGSFSNNKERLDIVMTTPKVTQKKCLPSLEASSVEENVQIQRIDASSNYPSEVFLSIFEKVWEEEFYRHLQISDEEGRIEVNNGNEHGGATTVSKEEYPSSLDKNLIGENDEIGENVQLVAVVISNNKGRCLTNSEKYSGNGLEVQILSEICDTDGSKGDGENRLALELKSSNENDELSVLETSKNAVIKNDDKENAAAFDDNRISNHDEDHAQRNLSQHEIHENQQKVVLDGHGKASKGNPALTSTGHVLGKYKKIKPTNPKPFRLRTDERVILREANIEKRHLSAPLQEITLVSRNSDGSTRRQTNEEFQKKVKPQGQHRLENNSHESNQVESYKPNKNIQHKKGRPLYRKTPKSVVEQNTWTTSTSTQKKLDNSVEREVRKRELRTTKSHVLPQQLMKTPRGTVTKKSTTISLVASRRLSMIREKSSSILRPKETKYRNKRTLPASISYAGISLAREKKPATVPKEPNFHTPRRCIKPASEAIHAPKSCKRASVEV